MVSICGVDRQSLGEWGRWCFPGGYGRLWDEQTTKKQDMIREKCCNDGLTGVSVVGCKRSRFCFSLNLPIMWIPLKLRQKRIFGFEVRVGDHTLSVECKIRERNTDVGLNFRVGPTRQTAIWTLCMCRQKPRHYFPKTSHMTWQSFPSRQSLHIVLSVIHPITTYLL